MPGHIGVHPAVWDEDAEFFERARVHSPHVVVSIERNPERQHPGTKRDRWGCLWRYPGNYLDGQVVGHALDSWEKLPGYALPSPDDYADWPKEAERLAREKREGRVAWGGVEHGFIYLRLTHLRGFENFMIDVAEGRRELYELTERIAGFWVEVVTRWAELGADAISFGDDLGHQTTLPISPEAWRELLKPAFARVFSVCRARDVLVYLHTDGWIVPIIGDLIETGVDVLNPQDLVNGLDDLARLARGKVGIDLDVDRQKITAFGTPEEVDRHVRTCVEKLGSPTGGLVLKHHAYPGAPARNGAQVILSMEKYHALWVGR